MMKVAEEKVLVPELRFSEFSDIWSEERLDQYFTFKNGVNADKSQYGSGHKFINVLDIIRVGPIYHEDIIGSVDISDKEFEKNEVIYGDILFQRSSEIREEAGQSNVYLDKNNSATFGGFVIRGRPKKKFDPQYFDALLKTQAARKEVTTKAGGSTRFNVGQDSLSEVTLNICQDEKEQQKIASFLTAVDDKLQLLRRKRDGLQTYKRGVMQQLFSQTLRFKQDDGTDFPDWEKKKIGQLFDWIKTNSLSREMLTTEKTNVQNIHYGDIHTKFASHFFQSVANAPYVKHAASDFAGNVFCQVGDLVIADASEDYGDIGKAIEVMEVEENTLVAGLHTYIARPKEIMAPGFAGYLFQEFNVRKSIKRIAQGISVLGISKTNLELIELPYPGFEEQQKIANYLSAIDKKIAAVTQQITQTGTFKQGLLQKMFV